MKKSLILSDAGGGINEIVPPSGIATNEVVRLENYYTDDAGSYFTKRHGMELIQYAPIDPSTYTTDANTLGLWHLDEAASPYVDSSGNGRDLSQSGPVSTQVNGLFQFGQKLTKATVSAGAWATFGFPFITSPVNPMNGLAQLCIEAWVNLDNSFSGRPITATLAGNPKTMSDSGALVIGSTTIGGSGSIGTMINGITVHRDWDAVNSQDSSAPYFKFTLKTNGIPGTTTVITGTGVPTGKWLHLRAEYDSNTALMTLYVNGLLHAQATVAGGGTVNNSTSRLTIGGQLSTSVASVRLYNIFNGIIDECRISSVTRTPSGFPFKKPRGQGFEFAKSDGTRQAVVCAETGLYYTLGNGEWTKIADGFSAVAYWDAAFYHDILYLSNGIDKPKAWDGNTLLPWGLPDVAPTCAVQAAGSVTAGDRLFAYTYLYGDFETGLSPSTLVQNAGAKGISVYGMPGRHSNCTGIRVYATKAGDTTAVNGWFLWREAANPGPGNTLTLDGTYVPGSSPSYSTDTMGFGPVDASLGTTGYPQIDATVQSSIMPMPRYLLAEHDRLLVCGQSDEPYTLRWSELGSPDVFTAIGFVRAATNKGNLIALASYYGEIHASKDGNATLVLRGSNPSNWSVFETLHPNIGCTDHWGYVHRYLVNEDRYTLCFPGRDGIYEYEGQQIKKISNKITPTFEGLAQNNATRDTWLTTTFDQWNNTQVFGGTATQNVYEKPYETDGLRLSSGDAQIADVLDYIGLWSATSPLLTGNVIAVAKADGEGCFYFAVDADNNLYYTTDNFITKSVVGATPLGASERIIQIVRRGTDDFWFVLTDSAGTNYTIGSTTVCKSSGGGKVYAWDNVGGAWSAGADTLYYDLDVPLRMLGNPTGLANGRAIGVTESPAPSGSALNGYINHSQTMIADAGATVSGNFTARFTMRSNPSLSGAYTGTVFDIGMAGNVSQSPAVSAGYYSLTGYLTSTGPGNFGFNITTLRMFYTHREYPRWRGGTFAPQAFWDATNSRLVFLGSSAEDANGNRTTYIRTIDSGLTLTTYNSPAATQPSAIAAQGTDLWFTTVQRNDSLATDYGFVGRSFKAPLTTPTTFTVTGPLVFGLIGLRLGYDSGNTALILAACKSYENAAVQQDFYNYTGSLRTVETVAGAFATLLALIANGDSGPVPVELAFQNASPYRWMAAVQNLTTAALYAIEATLAGTTDVSIQKSDGYESPTSIAGGQVGILSNLLFVVSSDTGGNNLWPDRLYWQGWAATSTDDRFVQLGIPGNWTLIGTFESDPHNLGSFNAFDTLESSYSGLSAKTSLLYEFRNAADPATLAATPYVTQAANTKILGFNPPQAYSQWRLTWTWTYAVADSDNTSASAVVKSVAVGFFLGNSLIPRIIGFHWNNRSYWAVATQGSPENNLILVYQKNGTWMKITGWNMGAMFQFRNQFVGLTGYRFVKLETGDLDDGVVIIGVLLTGTIMGRADKMLESVQSNLQSFSNNLFSGAPGNIKITPYQGSTPLTNAAWVLTVPNEIPTGPVRILGVPWSGIFPYGWARAFALFISTSDDTSGKYVPNPAQKEDVQDIEVILDVTGETYDIPVR